MGVTEPSNFGLGDLHLSQQVVAAGGSVEIQTDVSSLGIEGQRVVELDLLDVRDGKLQKISEQIKRLKPGESQTVDFRLTSLKPGTQQGRVRIVGQDSLAADDVRYFSVEVRPPWPVLVVAQQPTAETRHLPDRGHRARRNAEAPRGPFRLHGDRLQRTSPTRSSTNMRPFACSIRRAWSRAPGSA